jgi:phosphopantetheine adenylyltransferase/dephospho-CoA kinase
MSVVKVKSTLLFLTSTFNELIQNSRNLLEHSFKLTQSNLFIYVAPTLPPIVSVDKSRPQLCRLFGEFYVNSLKYDQRVNVVCLLNNLPTGSRPVKSNLEYDLVLTDFQLSDDLEQSIRSHLKSNFVKFDVEMRSIEPILKRSESFKSIELPNRENDLIAQEKTYRNSIIGGTFDRIHIGHKLLLTEALLLTSDRLLIGLADGPLLVKKKLADLIEDVSIREHHLRDLIAQMRPDLELVVEPIHDPYGPSITEPDYQCLIVSDETRTGGDAVNTKRVENGLNRLDLHVIALAQENALDPGDESKV